MLKMKLSPSVVLSAYVFLIILYALIYLIPGTLLQEDIDIIKAIYFSIVTITTLGYGDITPKSKLGMIVVSSEAILGIIIIGVFLNSIWAEYVRKIQENQEELISKNMANENINKILSYYAYVQHVIFDYKLALGELTTPLATRGGKVGEVNKDFKFSDMQDLYKGSLLTKYGFFSSVIKRYFEKQDDVCSELKYIMSNFDIFSFPNLHEKIIEFLSVSRNFNCRDVLLSYENVGGGGEKMSDTLSKMIKEHDECPDIEKYKSNVITPAILLYLMLRHQIVCIIEIDNLFRQITGRHMR